MATQAQIDANRRNAQKSTGPKTPDGKEKSAQNSLKHGLLARRFFVGPDQHAEFAAFRDALKNDIHPVGVLQTALADRIADLHWRLKQAQTLRSSILNTLIEKQLNSPDDLPGLQPADTPQQIEESLLAATVLADYAADRTLERLSVYEYRIERSLYSAQREYRSLRNFRAKEALINAKYMDTLEDNKYIYDAMQNDAPPDHPQPTEPTSPYQSPLSRRGEPMCSPIKQEKFDPIVNRHSSIINRDPNSKSRIKNSKLNLPLLSSVF